MAKLSNFIHRVKQKYATLTKTNEKNLLKKGKIRHWRKQQSYFLRKLQKKQVLWSTALSMTEIATKSIKNEVKMRNQYPTAKFRLRSPQKRAKTIQKQSILMKSFLLPAWKITKSCLLPFFQ